MCCLVLQLLHPSQIVTLYLKLPQAKLQHIGVPICQTPRLDSTWLHRLQANQFTPCSVQQCFDHCLTPNSDLLLNPRLPF